MEKRYLIFISSTYEDLKEERAEAVRAILRACNIPIGMEQFPATNKTQMEYIKSVIDNCDYYVILLGGRYGRPQENGKSYTEMEYEYALSKNIPVLAFIYKNPDNLPPEKKETSNEGKARFYVFREKLMKNRIIKEWEDKKDLYGEISLSLLDLIRDEPATGWVRGNTIASAELIAEQNALLREKNELVVQIKELKSQLKVGSKLNLFDDAELSAIYYNPDKKEHDKQRLKITLTWWELFLEIAPFINNRVIEYHSDMQSFLETLWVKYRIHTLDTPLVFSSDYISIGIKDIDNLFINFEALGLVEFENGWITVTEKGERLIQRETEIRKQLLSTQKEE